MKIETIEPVRWTIEAQVQEYIDYLDAEIARATTLPAYLHRRPIDLEQVAEWHREAMRVVEPLRRERAALLMRYARPVGYVLTGKH